MEHFCCMYLELQCSFVSLEKPCPVLNPFTVANVVRTFSSGIGTLTIVK